MKSKKECAGRPRSRSGHVRQVQPEKAADSETAWWVTGGTIMAAGITANLAQVWGIVLLEGVAVLLLGRSFV